MNQQLLMRTRRNNVSNVNVTPIGPYGENPSRKKRCHKCGKTLQEVHDNQSTHQLLLAMQTENNNRFERLSLNVLQLITVSSRVNQSLRNIIDALTSLNKNLEDL